MTTLQSTETDIQESNKVVIRKVEEFKENILRKEDKQTVRNLRDDFQAYQGRKDTNDEKTREIIDVLMDSKKNLTDGVNELKKDNAGIKGKLKEKV